MSSVLRPGLRVALNRPRVLGVVLLAVALETLVRVAVGIGFPMGAVLVPPVGAVLVLGLTLPDVRRAVADADAPPIRPPWRGQSDAAFELVGLALVGHVAALALGTAAFVLLDTPIRFAWYALGNRPPEAVLVVLPAVVGVTVATVVAWGLFAPVAARIVGDVDSTAPVRTMVETVVAAPRRTAGLLGLQLLGAVGILTGVFLALGLTRGGGAFTVDVAVTALVGGLVALLVALFLYPIHAAALIERPDPAQGGGRRIALAALVLSGAVLGAAAVRATETGPTNDRQALPEGSPAATYDTALENTLSGSHSITQVTEDATGEVNAYRIAADRRHRRLVVGDPNATRPPNYYSSDVAYGLVPVSVEASNLGRWRAADEPAWAVPAFFEYRPSGTKTLSPALPATGADGWRVVERGSGTTTVALTNGDAVARVLYDREFDDYEAASVRMRIDTDRGVVTGGHARLNASTADQHLDQTHSWRVETGDAVDVRRPDALGSPRPGELVWRVLAY